jgi:hypothetical protein
MIMDNEPSDEANQTTTTVLGRSSVSRTMAFILSSTENGWQQPRERENSSSLSSELTSPVESSMNGEQRATDENFPELELARQPNVVTPTEISTAQAAIRKFAKVSDLEREHERMSRAAELRQAQLDSENTQKKRYELDLQRVTRGLQDQYKCVENTQKKRYELDLQRVTRDLQDQYECKEYGHRQRMKLLTVQAEFKQAELQLRIDHLENEATKREEYYRQEIQNEVSRSTRLASELKILQQPQLVGRTGTGFPIVYDPDDLRAQWKQAITPIAHHISEHRSSHTTQIAIREHPSLWTVIGRPPTPNDNLDMDGIFKQCVYPPTDHSLVLACFMARAISWCFDTSFHIDQRECTKLHEIWESIESDCES